MARLSSKGLSSASNWRVSSCATSTSACPLNGYEAARRIREQRRRGSTLKLVALSGWGQEEDRRRSEAVGFDAHLVKPVDIDALSNLLVESGKG